MTAIRRLGPPTAFGLVALVALIAARTAMLRGLAFWDTAELLTPTLTSVPDRFALVDESQDRSAAAWIDHVLEVMEANAVIVSWWSYSTPLWYAQRVEGRRPDVAVVDDRTRLDENLGDITDVIDTHLGRSPVYVIRDDQREIDLLADRYDLEFIDGADARSLTRVLGACGSGS